MKMFLNSGLILMVMILSLRGYAARAATVTVTVQEDIPHFDPLTVTIHPGDTVQWIWNDTLNHAVVSGNGNTGTPNGIFNSGVHHQPFSYSFTFPDVGRFPYFCGVHYQLNDTGVWPEVDVVATTTPGVLGNISTRLGVGTNDNVLIGGFVIGGSGAKSVLLRALGPSLSQFGVRGVLADPVLELHDGTGALITTDDNWSDAANAQSIPIGLRPPDTHDSAILINLNPGPYTAIVRGLNNSTGVALVEAYDLDSGGTATLANISTRGLVQTGDNVMIAGLIVQSNNENVLVRALGPTLAEAPFNVPNTLADPMVELHDANGAMIISNDNWKNDQQSEITATGKAPPHDTESAIVRTLSPGNYTAIVSGVNNTTGVALVEVYALP